jgi:hypothetical protein
MRLNTSGNIMMRDNKMARYLQRGKIAERTLLKCGAGDSLHENTNVAASCRLALPRLEALSPIIGYKSMD